MQYPFINDLNSIERLIQGANIFGNLREEDIQVGVTPKEVIYQEDKLTLYPFTPQIEPSLNIRFARLCVD